MRFDAWTLHRRADGADAHRARDRRAVLHHALARRARVPGRSVRVDLRLRAAGGSDPAVPRRSYSIASQSDAGDVLRFIVRVIPEGTASEYLMSLPLHAVVNMTGPHGFFVLDPVHPGDVVFGATGTGIAAVMPMLGELARRPAGAPGPAAAASSSGGCGRRPISSRATRSRRSRRGPAPRSASTSPPPVRPGRAGGDASPRPCSIGSPGFHRAHLLPGRKRRHDHRAQARAHRARREPQDADPNRGVFRLDSSAMSRPGAPPRPRPSSASRAPWPAARPTASPSPESRVVEPRHRLQRRPDCR